MPWKFNPFTGTLDFYESAGSASSITSLTGEATAVGPGAAVVTLSNSAVIGKVLTGFTAGPDSTVLATDSILTGLEKLQAQVSAGTGAVTSLTGDVTGTGPGATTATVVSVGGSTASDVHLAALAYASATPLDTASALVERDSSGNFAAGVITASLTGNVAGNVVGNLTGNVTGNVSGSAGSFTGALSGDVTGTQSATAILDTVVTGKVLTGYAAGTSTPILATDSVLTAFEKLQAQVAVTIGNPNSVAGFDVSGILSSIPGWSFDSTGQVQGYVGSAGAADVTILQLGATIRTALTGGYEGVVVGAQLSSSMAYNSSFNSQNDYQTGFSITGGVSVFQDQNVLDVGADVPYYQSFNSSPTINATTVLGFTSFNSSVNVTSPVQFFQGFNVNANINAVTQGFTGFNCSSTINTAPSSGGINAFTSTLTFTPSSSASNVSIFNDYSKLPSGSVLNNYQSIQASPNLDAGSSLQYSTSFSATPNLNGAVTGNYTGLYVSPNGTGTIAQIYGINVNLANVSSGANQKIGLNVNDGALVVASNYDTSVYPASPGQFRLNTLGGVYTIASGSPVTNTLGFGNALLTSVVLQDDMGPDPFGVIGYSNNALICVGTVAAGKVVDTLNVAASAYTVLPYAGDGGTITNLTLFRAIGIVNEGGALNVTNAYGLRVDGFLTSMSPVNAWGISVEDSNADNFLSKSLAIGTLTKKVTNSDVALEIGSAKAVVFANMTTTQKLALAALPGMQVFDTTLSQMSYFNGTSWVNF